MPPQLEIWYWAGPALRARLVSFEAFEVPDDVKLNCLERRIHRRGLQHCNEALTSAAFVFGVRPSEAAFGLRVALEIEDFNVPIPDGLPEEGFMDVHGGRMAGGAVVKALHCQS